MATTVSSKLGAQIIAELERRSAYRRIEQYYPDAGPLRRELYHVHTRFFAAGLEFRERAIIAGNRIGKSELGAYETVCHLTGIYPKWWQGVRFANPVRSWAAGDTTQTVRDIGQLKLLGTPGMYGTGMIPGELIVSTKSKAGSVPDAIEVVQVRHISGGISSLVFKSYDQGRRSFQGTHQDFVWLDEECPQDIYTECLLRTMDTMEGNGAGRVILTFTPLMGLTPIVLSFLPGGRVPEGQEVMGDKYIIMAGWDDAPHLSEAEKSALLAACPPHQRLARSKGVPQLGAGAIYPIPEEDIVVPDFEIPVHWPRAYGLDVGWNNTAATWGAWDRDNGTLFLYACYKRGQTEPAVHAAAVKAKGDWIPGVIDPASRGRSQKDGSKLIEEYSDSGLELTPALNAVEAGIHKVYTGLSEGRIRVFRSLGPMLEEYRIYRRDDKGRVVKEFDHLMDSTRYLVMSGAEVATTNSRVYQPPSWRDRLKRIAANGAGAGLSHMAQ